MTALTVRQPWAGLIMAGVKDVENRSWPTSYRGRLLIHAASATDRTAPAEYRAAFSWERGIILGSVELVDCVRRYDSEWAISGQWHWLLRDARPWRHRPIVRGQLGLWEYVND